MWFGYIICYESSTWAFADTGRKSHKIWEFLAMFLGRHCERHFGAFEGPFWFHVRTILGPKWPKKAILNSTEKKVRNKSRGTPRHEGLAALKRNKTTQETGDRRPGKH